MPGVVGYSRASRQPKLLQPYARMSRNNYLVGADPDPLEDVTSRLLKKNGAGDRDRTGDIQFGELVPPVCDAEVWSVLFRIARAISLLPIRDFQE